MSPAWICYIAEAFDSPAERNKMLHTVNADIGQHIQKQLLCRNVPAHCSAHIATGSSLFSVCKQILTIKLTLLRRRTDWMKLQCDNDNKKIR